MAQTRLNWYGHSAFGTFPALTGTPEQLASKIKKLNLKSGLSAMNAGETITA
jgi:hypothetical protein